MMELNELLYPNIVAVILAITALAASRWKAVRRSRVTGPINVLFVVMLVMVALQIFNTWSNGVTIYWVVFLKYITSPIHNFFTVLYPGLCCIFVYEYTFIKGKHRGVHLLFISPSIVWAAVLIMNFWTGWVFTIDANAVYHRGPLVYVTFVLPVFSVVAALVISRVGHQENKNFLKFPIWTFALPAVGGVVVQAIFQGVNTIHLGLAIGICGACISIQQERMYIDSLTGLYNRNYIFYVFSKMQKKKKFPVAGIMIDINDFKFINDDFGHQEGDRALVSAGSLLEKSLLRGAVAVRFAGDEFIVLIRSKEIQVVLEDTLDRIRHNFDMFNKMDSNAYKLEYAAGASIMEDNESPDAFLARIDDMMYQEKESIKAKSNTIRRRA